MPTTIINIMAILRNFLNPDLRGTVLSRPGDDIDVDLFQTCLLDSILVVIIKLPEDILKPQFYLRLVEIITTLFNSRFVFFTYNFIA